MTDIEISNNCKMKDIREVSKKLLLEEIDNLFINIRKKFDIQINNGTRATYKNKGTRGRRRKFYLDFM